MTTMQTTSEEPEIFNYINEDNLALQWHDRPIRSFEDILNAISETTSFLVTSQIGGFYNEDPLDAQYIADCNRCVVLCNNIPVP